MYEQFPTAIGGEPLAQKRNFNGKYITKYSLIKLFALLKGPLIHYTLYENMERWILKNTQHRDNKETIVTRKAYTKN